MIKLDNNTKKQLIELYETKKIGLEGNITKMIDTNGDDDLIKYIENCINKDRDARKKRLEITKQVQSQNDELQKLNIENQRIMEELQQTLKDVEESKMTYEVQNRELNEWKQDNLRLTEELKNEMAKSELARIQAENAKKTAETDLDVLQKKTQFELINTIVKSALWIIIGVGVTTTLLYLITIFSNKDTQIISSTWSNMFGILLTNAFSIVGTIMGVKYASEKKED